MYQKSKKIMVQLKFLERGYIFKISTNALHGNTENPGIPVPVFLSAFAW